tara:strand:- start:852 stop:1958 length:1107 start_codon:yes stop_codon:yes gene_type:complete
MSRARTFADLATASEAGSLTSSNIIINGDMSVAQRGTSSTSSSYQTVDRFSVGFGQVSVTQSQQALTSGSPYEAGFNNFIRMANTSTSSNAAAYVQLNQNIEAQHIANSGWNFKSSSSFVTLSFWARSSLAGTYYVRINTDDGTAYYRIKAFALSADTWTKVTFTIEGNSNLTINDDNGAGLSVVIVPHYGTTYSGSNASTTAWFTLVSNDYFPDFAQNWANTSSATFDVTGIQLELGEVATPYKHESFGDNLLRCQRYFYKYISNNIYGPLGANGMQINTNSTAGSMYQGQHPIMMRTAPTMAYGGTWTAEVATGSAAFALTGSVRTSTLFWQSQEPIPTSGANDGYGALVYANNDDDAFLSGDAEL